NAAPRLRDSVRQQAAALSLDTILAGLDILQSAKVRLRGSGHGRVLVEMALIRLARLDDLVSLTQIAPTLQGGEAPAGVAAAPATSRPAALPPADGPDAGKKKSPDPGDGANGAARRLTTDSLAHVWSEILTQTGPILARELDRAGLPAISEP